MKIKIKNYTSSMPIERSVQLLERELVQCGAVNIQKIYKNGKIEKIMFQIDDPKSSGHLVPICLPVRVDEYRRFLASQGVGCNPLQAERTAWKSLLELTMIQLDFVKMKRVELLEIFLPYVWRGDQTYYHELKNGKFLALENK